jgi:hypothetical protein
VALRSPWAVDQAVPHEPTYFQRSPPFRVQGSCFRVFSGSRFMVYSLGFRIQGSKFGVWGARSGILGLDFWALGLGFKTWGLV